MNHTFICTRTENNPAIDNFIIPLVKSDISRVHVKVGAESIFKGYSELLKENKIDPNDTVVLCHDDIFFITSPQKVYELINNALSNPDTGFIGVAGTNYLSTNLIWWSRKEKCRGTVFHGKNESNMVPTYYGPAGEVVCLDGVFLACKAGLLYTLGLDQPEYFSGGWDFYDILWTLQARMSYKKRNYVLPFLICHNSPGNGIHNNSWKNNKAALTERLANKLPIICSK